MTFGWGRVSEGSDFYIYVFATIFSKPILYVQWLAGFPFFEAVILYNLLFQFKLHHFFVVLPNLQVGKLKLSNSVDVRLIPCLVEWMIS